MKTRIMGAFFAGLLAFTGATSVVTAQAAEPSQAAVVQTTADLRLKAIFTATGNGATPAATKSCSRMSDWFGSCKCPAGYQAIVSWTSPTTGVSRAWTGGSFASMSDLRGVGSVYGENPQVRYGTGPHSLATGRALVYYGDGQGGGNPQLTMWATCSNVF